MDATFTKIKKNSFEEIHFSLREFKGHQLVDIRIYVDRGTNEQLPTKKGVSIPIELYGEFSQAISILEDRLEEAGLFDPRM